MSIIAAVVDARVEVDVLPDEEGYGLWVNDLEIGAHGADLEEARRNLVGAVRAYVANFLGKLPVYLAWPDRARLVPHHARLVPQVLRLAMARDDIDLARMPLVARLAAPATAPLRGRLLARARRGASHVRHPAD